MSVWQKLEYLWPPRRRAVEREMQEEIAALEEIAGRRELGNLTLAAENARSEWGWDWLEGILADLRYAVRVLWKSPAFTTVAVVSLALGIGANTAVFSVVHSVLLRPLPYPEPNHLVRVGQHGTANDVSIPEFEFWKEHSSALASVAGDRGSGDLSLAVGDKREEISAMTVTSDFFRTLGVHPAMGREFDSKETRPGGPRAIVLSDSLWRRAFGADPSAVGRAAQRCQLHGRRRAAAWLLVPTIRRRFCPSASHRQCRRLGGKHGNDRAPQTWRQPTAGSG
jgi:hypothetical protein